MVDDLKNTKLPAEKFDTDFEIAEPAVGKWMADMQSAP